MSRKELKQVWVMSLLLKRDITQLEAAEICNLSVRQIRRKYKKYIKEGPTGLINASRRKPSNRKTKPKLLQKIVSLLKTTYAGFGATLAAEKLYEKHDIKIHRETLRRLMIKNGLHEPRKKKFTKRLWREPKHHKGELVQLDGSYHIWFGNEYSTLIVFIDDATKEIFCRFAKESTEGVTKTFELYLKKYGRPLKLYTDKGKVFKVNNSKQSKNAITQFVRMLKELDIEIQYAHSPQAKGRVERVNRTLQDRLIKELKLMNINTIEAANKMLDGFLEKFNSKFTVNSKSQESFFRSLDGYDLNSILCYKFKRKLNNDYTLSYRNRWFQLLKSQPIKLISGDIISVDMAFDGTITLSKNGSKLVFKEIQKPIKLLKLKKKLLRTTILNQKQIILGGVCLNLKNRTFLWSKKEDISKELLQIANYY